VAVEFPSVHLRCENDDGGAAHVRASEWRSRDFDHWQFDLRIDGLADQPLLVGDDGGSPDLALEVLTRCQRAVGRRNVYSEGTLFDRILARHRALHDLERPLVRADYNHALDAWQWVLRLEPRASLAVQIAALFHDVERLLSESEARVEHLAGDYQRFKDAHALQGALMTRQALTEVGAHALGDRVASLVAAHERPSDDSEVRLLNDADALSFFSLNSSGYADYFGPEQTRKKVAYTWNRMGPAARAKLPAVRLRDDVRAFFKEVIA
jgi:hypothetical protein